MGEVVAFPKKKRKRLRPNRKEGRPPADLKVFPVLQSANREYIDSMAIDVAAGHYDVPDVLKELYEADYWSLPREVVQKDFNRVGWHLYRKANAIRNFCGLPNLEPPNGRRRNRHDTPPSAA